MSCELGLISLGVGYIVFLSASKESGSLRQAGRIIGAVIIVLSIVGAVCAMKCYKGVGGKSAPMCPFTVKAK
jgi:hypothetical protein